jgi:formate hydrogenlyase subunit 6/NADH:ubiquinone oxidoreductase subunit I
MCAYFSNSCEGIVFDYQCTLCKWGEEPCPIALVQHEYNYEACNNTVARKILDELVENNGTCAMWKQFKNDLRVDPNAKDQSLFDEIFNKKVKL